MRGGACLPAAIMLQSGPWFPGIGSFALWSFAHWTFAAWSFVPSMVWVGAPWIPALLVATAAGITDWRYRRIPNWLTVSGFAAGVTVNTILYRWPGLKAALLGALLGLGLLLPFVLLRSLGAGDWKLAGALGACLGPGQLISVLMGTILVAGVMALAVIVWKGRLKRTLLNIAHLVAALFRLQMPGHEVSLDDPQSTKIPFGVAMALTVLFYGIGRAAGYDLSFH
jgi:prepilin peptidase CpaA